MNDLILRNIESAQYLYGAKKNFILRNGITSESSSKVLIGHCSDLHGDRKRFENCLTYFDYFGADLAIHTGDLVKWDMQDEHTFFGEADCCSKIPLYNCIGNHETFRGADKLSNETLHEALLSRLKNINTPNRRGYYFVDFPKHKLRIIALNNYDYDAENAGPLRERYTISQAQCDWLIETLKTTEPGYGVILFSHESDIPIPSAQNDWGFCQRFEPYPWSLPIPHEHIIADIIDAFKHGKEIKKEFTWEASGLHISIHDKFEAEGEFICYLNGHRHGDYVGWLPGFSDQLSIGMTCSGCYPEGYHNIGEEISDLPRIPDTVTEDAVNFYTIDREAKVISIVRVGAAVNDIFETRRALQINYDTCRRVK